MEVRPGYKPTEVGAIPETWASMRLGDCARFRTGPFGSALHRSDYTDDGVPVVNPMHIVAGRIEPTQTMTVTERAAEALPAFRLKEGDVVMGRRGDMGRCALVRPEESGWLCGTGSMIIRCGDTADPAFLQRVLSSPRAVAALENASVGSTMVNLNQGTLAALLVQVPPLPEQRAIAGALGDVDALLDGLDRLIAKKRDLKQAAMQQLLTGQTRLPAFTSNWDAAALRHVGCCLRGVSYQGDADLSPSDTPLTRRLLRANNVQNAVVATDELQFVRGDRVASQQILKKGDILVCMANGSRALVGKAAMFSLADGFRYTFGAFMGCFRTEAGVAEPSFVSYLFQTAQYRHYINNLLAGSSINNLRPSAIESLVFSFPPHDEQAAIAEALSDMDAELATLEARREKTRALKQAMMQELLTGRIRLV